MNSIEIIDKNEISQKQLKKLELDQTSASQINMFVQSAPSLLQTAALNGEQLYVCSAPLSDLSRVKDGYGNMIRAANGQFVEQATFNPVQVDLIAMNVFATMSIATGQYFLKQINDEFKVINQKVDAIVDFLYGDKKAELMAEISFVQYAYKNFSAIMKSDAQRTATIASLQEARKVALKDIEFYMADMEKRSMQKKKSDDFKYNAEQSIKIEQTLQMAEQLYALSSIMEIYFSENRDPNLNNYIRDDVTYYINKCDKRTLANMTRISEHEEFKQLGVKPIDTSDIDLQLNKITERLRDGNESDLCKITKDSINAYTNTNKYYINSNGEVFIKELN